MAPVTCALRVERDDTIGAPLTSLGNGQWDVPALTQLLSEVIPKATAVIDYEVTHDFPSIGRRTFLLTARRMWKPDDNSTNSVLVFTDVSESRAREREGSLLLSELRHRMTNLLSVVRAVANQTDTKGKSADEYKAVFLGRFEAILAAQQFLIGGGAAADLGDIISAVVSGLAGDRLKISAAPATPIAEKQVVPLTMILHELGTNALKYGALSGQSGTVDVSWLVSRQDAAHTVNLTWRETCSFEVSQPKRRGTGTDVIQSSASYALKGVAELAYQPTGLVFNLTFPLIE